MATTTSNFSWPIPQSTDLVKDGATAIASLGSGIDTSMADLKGGTTNQILSKASNTDMDFAWITPNPGDITGVTAGTGITGGGTSGDVTVSFDVANYGGGEYAAGKNKIINGDFNINQRAFSSTTADSAYTFDRFAVRLVNGTVSATASIFTLGAAPVAGYEGKNYITLASSGQSATNAQLAFQQVIESVRTFAGQTVTASFWAKAASGTPKLAIELQQQFGGGGSPSAAVYTYAGQVTLSTSWARYSVTVAVPSISGKTLGTDNTDSLTLKVYASAGTDLNSRTGSLGIQSNTFDFWGVQLEAGSTATPFQTATGTKQGELAACQRYYIRYSADATYSNFATGGAQGTVVARGFFALPVEMRSAPTTIESSNLAFVDILDNIFAMSSVIIVSASENKKSPMISGTVSGATAGRPGRICANNSTSAYVAFSAEL